MQAIHFSLALVATVALCGCAVPPQPDRPLAEVPAQRDKCVQVTGSSVCRKEGSGQIANVQSIPGEALRKSPDAMVGPTPGKVGN